MLDKVWSSGAKSKIIIASVYETLVYRIYFLYLKENLIILKVLNAVANHGCQNAHDLSLKGKVTH